MSKKQFNIKPKTWPKEYTFEEFKRLNPNINENLLINYYNKYLQDYSQNYSRHIKHFEDTKKLLSSNLQEIKNKYKNSQYFLNMSYGDYMNPSIHGAIQYHPFTPTDIKGLTHWFKVEPSQLTTQAVVYNNVAAESPNIQEVTSWSNAVNPNSFLLEDTHSGNTVSGYLTNNGSSIGFFRGRFSNAGNTGGQRMRLSDNPSFGTFTYFAVLELTSGDAVIQARTTQTNDTGSVVFTTDSGDANATDRTILLQVSTTTAENYRIVFSNDSLSGANAPNYSSYFSEQVLTASISSHISAAEITDNQVSGSTLASAIADALNTIPNITASAAAGAAKFIRYKEISSYTNLPHDGNFYNAYGDADTVVISSNFSGTLIIQSAATYNNYHGIWAGQNGGTGNMEITNNNMHLYGRPEAITGSMNTWFSMAASSSKDTGDTTGTVAQLANDPENNKKFVFMVTKDAPENALLKVYINNVSSFESPNPTGSLELDELAHFEPKYFGQFAAQSRTLNGHVYEMGFYTGSLSENDRNQLYYYLSTKHNIPGYVGPSELQPYNYPY